jgi:dienelactone hydrolase
MANESTSAGDFTNDTNGLSRRDLARAIGAGVVAVALPATAAVAAEGRPATRSAPSAAPGKSIEPLNRFPRMVQEYFVHVVRQIESTGMAWRAALKTKEDAERYVEDVRKRVALAFGPLPEKTPLNPKITGVVERDTYRIEKVIFESRPGFFVTSNLYIPKGAGKKPGVVGTCGHSADGKANETYQSFAQGLARLGYVALIYDPIGQGERLQYPNDALKSRVGVGVAEHLLAGNQQFLVDEFLGTWRAWDGIRALDYLLTRDEVDPKHVGVTGNSGGGTLTTWLCGLERRWTMAAPSCFVTTFRRNMENELPADTEQCPPRTLALGLDHADFLIAMAPKPVQIMSQEKDYFDRRGAEEANGRMRQTYALLGAEENAGLFVGPRPHGYHIENREAMYRWFNKFTGVSKEEHEPQLTIEKEQTLWCTPRGQVGPDLNSRSVMSFTAERSKQLAKQRKPLDGGALRVAVAETLKLPPPQPVDAPDYRILRPIKSRGYPKKFFTTYAVETEPGIQAIVYRLGDEQLMSRPTQGIDKAILYVSHQSSDAELRSEPLVKELIAGDPEAAFYACDVRGIGESQPDTCGENSFLTPYGSDYFYAIHSIMLDRPYPGRRTHDLLRVLEWLAAQGHREVHLAARGWGAIPGTFAALLSPVVTRVTLKNALTSYTALAETEQYTWPLSSMVLGALKRFDLPDCYRVLEATKKLKQVEPWGAASPPKASK